MLLSSFKRHRVHTVTNDCFPNYSTALSAGVCLGMAVGAAGEGGPKPYTRSDCTISIETPPDATKTLQCLKDKITEQLNAANDIIKGMEESDRDYQVVGATFGVFSGTGAKDVNKGNVMEEVNKRLIDKVIKSTNQVEWNRYNGHLETVAAVQGHRERVDKITELLWKGDEFKLDCEPGDFEWPPKTVPVEAKDSEKCGSIKHVEHLKIVDDNRKNLDHDLEVEVSHWHWKC
jgi:hypothetical protein